MQQAENKELEEEIVFVEEGDLNEELEEVSVKPHDEYDDVEEYGSKVRKRINKEVSKRKKIESERDIYRKELETTQRNLAEVKKLQLDAERKRLAAEIESLQKGAATALEDGETETYLDLNNKMVDAKVNLAKNDDYSFEAQGQNTEPALTDAAANWVTENQQWIDEDPAKFKRAKRLSDKLEGEGFDIADPDFYAELDSRLNTTPARQQSTVNVPGSTEVSPPGRPKRFLTNQDKSLMREYGMNPDSAEHRKAWLDGKGAA